MLRAQATAAEAAVIKAAAAANGLSVAEFMISAAIQAAAGGGTMKRKYFFINRRLNAGVEGDLFEAVTALHPFASLNASDFEEVTRNEYENTVLDWRFSHGEWEQ